MQTEESGIGLTHTDYCVFLSGYIYFTLIIAWFIVHLIYRRDSRLNKHTLVPYYFIGLYGIFQVMTFFIILSDIEAASSLVFWNGVISIMHYFWVAIALSQFLIWDLTSVLVKFQAKYRLEEIDVNMA